MKKSYPLLVVLFLLSLTLPGCISESENPTTDSDPKKCEPEIKVVHDTTLVHDTIVVFTGPVIPNAPFIVDATKEFSVGSFFVKFIVSPEKSAVGYKCYVSSLLDGPYVETGIVSLTIHDKYIEFTDVVDQSVKGNRFYKVSGINNSGTEGEKSPQRLVYFN